MAQVAAALPATSQVTAESCTDPPPGGASSGGSAEVVLAAVRDLRGLLAHVSVGCADSERIDLIAELERVKSAAAAAQARLTAALADGHLH